MNENYNGIAEDIRSEEEKAKDYKAKDLLGYNPKYSIKAGLKESIDWYWKNLKNE